MKKSFKLKSKVWRWPGDTAWHFVTLDRKLSANIRKAYPKGFVKIQAKIGGTAWDTSLFPHKLSNAYLLSIKALVRKKEEIFEGDEVKLEFKII